MLENINMLNVLNVLVNYFFHFSSILQELGQSNRILFNEKMNTYNTCATAHPRRVDKGGITLSRGKITG